MLTGLFVLIMVVIGVLAIPVSLTYQLSWRSKFEGQLRIGWLFGIVNGKVVLGKSAKAPKPADATQQNTRHEKRRSRRTGNIMSALRLHAFRRRILRFMQDCWRAIKKREMSVCMRVGLGDPADTGQLWAVLGPLSGMLKTVPDIFIELEPDFFESLFELDSQGSVRVIPLQLLANVLGLLLSPALWQGVYAMRAKA